MSVATTRFRVKTKGDTEIINLTDSVAKAISNSGIKSGIATVFVVGSTAAIATTEFEPGLVNTDFRVAFERIAPEDGDYAHEATWDDDNGHSHIRASLMGPSIVVPFLNGAMTLGTWQQIVLFDFDTRPRDREIIVQLLGE